MALVTSSMLAGWVLILLSAAIGHGHDELIVDAQIPDQLVALVRADILRWFYRSRSTRAERSRLIGIFLDKKRWRAYLASIRKFFEHYW